MAADPLESRPFRGIDVGPGADLEPPAPAAGRQQVTGEARSVEIHRLVVERSPLIDVQDPPERAQLTDEGDRVVKGE